MLHKANIAGLTIDPASNTPIIILKTEDEERAIPIWIGLLEATSIASALQNMSIAVTQRKSRGQDIEAACGQLAAKQSVIRK